MLAVTLVPSPALLLRQNTRRCPDQPHIPHDNRRPVQEVMLDQSFCRLDGRDLSSPPVRAERRFSSAD